MSYLCLSLGGLLFVAAVRCCFLKKAHPLAMALLASVIALLGALFFQLALAVGTFEVLAPLARGGRSDAQILQDVAGTLSLAQLGLVLLLGTAVVIGLQWWRRRSDCVLHSRLTSQDDVLWAGVHLVVALLAAGSLVLYENGGRIVALGTATMAPSAVENLPAGLVRILAWTRAQNHSGVGGWIAFRYLAGLSGSLCVGILLLILAAVIWKTGRIEEEPDSATVWSAGRGWRRFLAPALLALVTLGAVSQIWRMEEVKSWLPAIEAGRAAEDARIARRQALGLKPWLAHVAPVYPEAARAAGVQGEVQVWATIDSEGSVVDVSVVEGDPLLRQAAIDAVMQWKMDPAWFEGAKTPMRLLITLAVKPE